MPTPEEELQKLKPMTALGGQPENTSAFGGGFAALGASPGASAGGAGAFAPMAQTQTKPAPAAPVGAPVPATQSLDRAPGAPAPQLDKAPGAPAAPAPSQPAPQAGPIDPNQAATQLKDEFAKKFGRQISEAEIAGLQKNANWKPGDPVTPEVMARMSQLIQAYSGDPNNPGQIPPPPGSPAAPPPVSPGMQTANLTEQMIQQLLTTGSTPAMSNVDMNNPAILAQRTAFDRANAQATTKERLAASERAAARGGLGSGGFDANLAGIERGAGDRAVNFQSQLMQGELQGQRDRVMQALALAQKSGSETQQRDLQQRLADLDAAIRREGIGSQERLGKGQLSLGLLQALMGDQRAKDALGFNYAQLGQQGKQFDINTILNGL